MKAEEVVEGTPVSGAFQGIVAPGDYKNYAWVQITNGDPSVVEWVWVPIRFLTKIEVESN